MKRTLILMAVAIMSISVSLGQNAKVVANKLKQYEKAKATISDPSKQTYESYIEYSNILVDMNELYTSGLYSGMDQVFAVNLVGRPIGATEEVTYGQSKFKKIPYEKFDLFVTEDNKIIFWEYKEDPCPNALSDAYDCLVKAKNLNAQGFMGTGKGAIAAENLKSEYETVAMFKYHQTNYADAAQLFVKATECSELTGVMDTIECYYACLCFACNSDYENSRIYGKKLIEVGYSVNGQVEGLYAEVLTNLGRADESIEILEAAIKKYPSNMDLLFKLINAYLKANKDPKTVISLIHQAQKTDSSNLSLYMVEARLNKEMGDTVSYVETLKKVIQISPKTPDPYYELASIEIDAANAAHMAAEKLPLNDTKGYEAKQQERYEALKKAVAYYEKIYEINPKDVEIVGQVRQIYYQLRGTNDPKYDELYTKFNDLYKELSAQAEAAEQK